MSDTFRKIRLALTDPYILKRIFIALSLLVVFRALNAVPIPGVNQQQLEALFAGTSALGQFLGLVNLFSGGGLQQLSIVMLGVGPYITASIIMQLLTIMSPKLKAMYQGEDGEGSRRKFIQYSRLLTIPLAVVQGYSFITLLERQGVVAGLDTVDKLINVLIITAGSMFVLWLGELISEFGIGNGTSLIITAGIISALPTSIAQSTLAFTQDQIPMYLAYVAVSLVVILGVVAITESERPVPVTYAKQVRGNRVSGGISTYLPIRLTQTGVMPIIFALSILLFPQIVANLLTLTENTRVIEIATKVNEYLANGWVHGITYFILVFAFTYFYTAIVFDPHQIAENLQKRGAFVPGIRPGLSTAEYLGHIITRLTLFGALFLGLIAVLPNIVSGLFNLTALTIGGTSVLIVVSVMLDLLKKIGSQVTAREY